jgi:hypothetical protein
MTLADAPVPSVLTRAEATALDMPQGKSAD